MAVNASPPPYSPNTVNQTVDYNGITWKGNPGSGWTPQTASGGAPVSTGDPVLDAAKMAQWAQAQQITANQPAIQTIQGQQTNLQQSYKDLLASILQSGTVSENQAVTGENNLLGQRGIVNTSPLYNQQMSSALLPVESQYKSLASNLGLGSAQDMNQLAGQIAGLQAGNVPQAQTFGQNLGNISAGLANTQTQYGEALQAAQLDASKPFGVGNIIFSPARGGYIYPSGNTGGGGNSSRTVKAALRLAGGRSTPVRPQAASIGQYVHAG